MKTTMSRRIAIFARRTLFTLAYAAFAAGATYSQGTGGPGGNPGGKPATNADILNMLSAGLSEETILTTMRTRPAKFDVSNQARAKFDKECAKIKHVGVTTVAWAAEVKNIWDAMTDVVLCQETNGRGGEGCAPSGQQAEPKPATNSGRSAQPDAAGHKRGDYSALVPAIQRPAVNDGNVAAAGGINNGNRNADELSPQPYPPKGTPSAGQSQAAGGQRSDTLQPATPANPNALNAGSTPVPSKTNRRNEYESVTLERGVTQDTGFANWANSGQAPTSPHELPALPPINSNPKRDASGPADTATKAEIKRKLELQIAGFEKSGLHLTSVMTRPVEKNIREVELLKRQKTFVEALRKQAGIAPLNAGGQLGANSRTMSATQQPQRNGKTITGSAPAPISGTPSGSSSTGGTLLLGSGTNQTGSKTVASPQTVTPSGSSSTGGTLALGGGTNQTGSKAVASPQTVTPAGEPVMRPAPTSPTQHPVTPNSPGTAARANSPTNVRLAAGSISGYILWDSSTVHYQLSAPCQGLKVTISTGSNGSLQTLASSTNFTTPFGPQPVWNFSGQGSQGPWMACSYAFFKLPEEVPLEVDAVVTQTSAFTPAISLAPLQKNQFEISGGNCGSTPQSTLGVVLNSGSILCGDYAFNVNFSLHSRLNAALTNTSLCLGTQIYTVNGVNSVENASNPVVFTQDPAYNDYIITGCGFGNGEGGQVYLSGAVNGGRINMTVLQWSPTQIEAVVQWGLTGVTDGWPDLIVVPPGGGAPGKFPNCRFYAQRQSVLLPGIPQRFVHLNTEQVGDSTHGFGTNYCPGPDLMHLFPCISFNGGTPLDGVSNGGPSVKSQTSENVTNAVDRDGGQLKFSPGEDVYDLSYLAPGFAIDRATARWYNWSESVCEMWAAEDSGKLGDSINWDPAPSPQYGVQQKGTQIAVDWGVDHCAWRWAGIFNVDDEYNAGYSLEVYVKGPIGVDPWTGPPTASH